MAKVTIKNGKKTYELSEAERASLQIQTNQRVSQEDRDRTLFMANQLGNEIQNNLSSTEYQTVDQRRDTARHLNSYERYLGVLGGLGYNVNRAQGGLNSFRETATARNQYFSQFANAEEMDAFETQSRYRQAYSGKTYDELMADLQTLDPNSDEYRWVSSFAPSVMTTEDYDRAIADAESRLNILNNIESPEDWNTELFGEFYAGADAARRRDIENEIVSLKGNRWQAEQRQAYGDLQNEEGFAERSSAEHGFTQDADYNYINNINSVRSNRSHTKDLQVYDNMTDTEIATYNYLYNTEGKKAAKEYLDYLRYDLNARAAEIHAQNWSDFATQNGANAVAASAMSVGANLIGGIGALNLSGQWAANKVRGALTGEYRPVDYNTAFTAPTRMATAIRGGVAQQIADSTGTINMPVEEHPFLGYIFDGKNLGDIYNHGMSMADSVAIAALYPVLGSYGTLLLGGAAATQTMLDYAASGATDDQAIAMGIVAGAIETITEALPLETLYRGDAKSAIQAILRQAGTEAGEEAIATFANNIADFAIAGANSIRESELQAYLAAGMSVGEARKRLLIEHAVQLGWDALGGFVSGGVMGGGAYGANKVSQNRKEFDSVKALYGEDLSALVEESFALNPDNKLAHKVGNRVSSSKKVSGRSIYNLVQQNEDAMLSQDIASIQGRATERLSRLGEPGDIHAIAAAVAKQTAGKTLTQEELNTISESRYGRQVASELSPEFKDNYGYTPSWIRDIGSARINVAQYNQLVSDAQMTQESTQTVSEGTTAPVPQTASVASTQPVTDTNVGNNVAEDTNVPATNEPAQEERPVTLEEASEKYGAQAKAMVSTYNIGGGNQDVAKFDAAYKAAYTVGKELGSLSYVMNSPATAYLTSEQKELAYDAGVDATDIIAKRQRAFFMGASGQTIGEVMANPSLEGISEKEIMDFHEYGAKEAKRKAELQEERIKKEAKKIKKKSTDNAVHRKGAVTWENAGIEDLTENIQVQAYNIIKSIAEVTGFNIVLYKSGVNSKGKFTGVQGEFRHNEPYTIRVDINAGLNSLADVGNIASYTMLRTFTHEFTHTLEYWNPTQYNELKQLVFAELNARGKNVTDLIEYKMSSTGLVYDDASHEVIAEALCDILPDSTFVQTLAEKHNGLFHELLAKLKEFIQSIKDHFASLSKNSPQEARALQEEVDGSVRYLENIVQLFDKAVVGAVENMQSTMQAKTETDAVVEQVGVEIDHDTTSAAPSRFSLRTWTESEYVKARDDAAKVLAKQLKITEKQAKTYIDNINGIAALIADDKVRLDYEPNMDIGATVLKPNSEYKFTVDMSTLCSKRLLFTGTFDAIQKALPNTVFDSDDIVNLRKMMVDRGLEVACGICYVESTRREIGRITQDFIERYKLAQKTGNPVTRLNSEGKEVVLKSEGRTFAADPNYTPNLGDLNTTDIDLVKRDHREVYDAYLAFMNARGQAKPKLLETRAEYKGEILRSFKAKSAVKARNDHGGLRLQSFSDFEVPHMIDMMQVIMDMSRVGLKSQAYTKVPAFAEVFGGTGVKINLSLIAKGDGVDANGNLIFDDVEGMNHKDAFRIREMYSENVGTILVGKNDNHIIKAMADPRIDFIIPFHKSSWKESLYDALGLRGYDDYTDTQNEKPIDPARGKLANFDPSEYWDFTKTGDENAQIYLQKCRKDGRIPKFPQFQGYPGYWKLLIDFKMYDNEGNGVQQQIVKPEYNMEAATRILNEYKGGHRSFPVANDVVDAFVKDYKELHNEGVVRQKNSDIRYQRRDNDGNSEVAQNSLDDGSVKRHNKRSKYSETETRFLIWANGSAPVGEVRAFMRFQKIRFYEKTETGCVELSKEQYNERNGYDAANTYRGAKRKVGNASHSDGRVGGRMPDNSDRNRNSGTASGVSRRTLGKELRDDVEGSVSGSRGSDSRAVMTESRIDDLINDSGAGKRTDYAQAWITSISPTDFLNMTLSKSGQNRKRFDNMPGDYDSTVNDYDFIEGGLKTSRQTPYLAIDVDTGEVVGHEGRHRMRALEKAGVTYAEIKVEFRDSDGYVVKEKNGYGNPLEVIDSLTIYNQTGTGQSAEISNIIPLNKANRENVLRSYGDAKTGDIQYQQRGDTLTDREVLELAAREVNVEDLTDGERESLRIFNERLQTLRDLQMQRIEQGRIFHDNTFKQGGSRDEAAKAKNRMAVLDAQIAKAESALLDVEDKAVLKTVLKKARGVVEQQERQRSETQLQRWRDRRNNSATITKYKERIKADVSELNRLLLHGDKKRHVPENLKKAVAAALAMVNMDTVGSDERIAKYEALIAKETDPDKIEAYTVTMENIRNQGEKIGQRLKELKDAYEEIANSTDPDIANAYDPVIAGSLQELAGTIGDTSLRDMTVEQLEDVSAMYRMVLTRVRDANKTFLDDKRQSISNLASRVVGEVRRVGGEHKNRAAILDPIAKFKWDNQKPVYAMEAIGSDTMIDVFNELIVGEGVYATDVSHASGFADEKKRKYKFNSWDFNKKYRFTSTSGIEFDLTLEQIMSLYAYSKRNQAHDHLRLGGFVFDSNIETYEEKGKKGKKGILKYKVNTADAHQLTPEILLNIIGKLSAEQRAFVDEMQEYLSTVMGAKGNEVTMKMYGVKLFKEKFYFPLKSAKQFMFEQNEAAGEVKIKNSGFTNKLVAKANNPIILNNFMDVWAGHVHDMSMYHSFVLPLEDFNRVFNYNSQKAEGQPPVSVKGTIQSAYGPAAVSYIKQLITDLNGGAVTDPRETIAKAAMSNFKKAAVLSSMSVVIQQPSAIGRATALVDSKYFIGPKVDSKRHKARWAEVKKYAPVAIIKEMGYFDTGMGRSAQDFIKGNGYDSLQDKAKAVVTDSGYRDELLSKLPALADELTWCAIWEAVKRETKAKNKGIDVNSEAFLKMAGKRFTEVITKTQVYDSVLSRSGYMRSKSGLMNMMTSFMAEPTTTANMVEDALRKGKRGNKKYAARTLGAVLASITLNALLSSLVYAARDDDEDETFLEKYLQSFATEMLDGINPLTYYPFLKDIWSALQGFDIERADMSLVTRLVEATTKLVQVYNKDTSNMDDAELKAHQKDIGNAWWGLVDYVTAMVGLPVKNVRRDIIAGFNVVKTIGEDLSGRKTTWGSLIDKVWDSVRSSIPVVGWLRGETAADKLYEATVSGDKAYQERLESAYETQTSLDNAIRRGLRANDSRIWEAAIAWNENNLTEYMRIAREIVDEGNFSQDNVVMAIRAEADAMLESEADTSTPKAKGYFTMDKFAVAISQGNGYMADAIMEDVIATAQRNGKTAEEAVDSFESSARSSLREMYLDGDITAPQITNALVDYCGYEVEDAEEYVGGLTFELEHPELDGRITYTQYQRWQVNGEPNGVSLDVFTDVAEYRDDGTSNGARPQEEVAAYINSLPISTAQKDALWCCFWKETTLHNAPWH